MSANYIDLASNELKQVKQSIVASNLREIQEAANSSLIRLDRNRATFAKEKLNALGRNKEEVHYLTIADSLNSASTEGWSVSFKLSDALILTEVNVYVFFSLLADLGGFIYFVLTVVWLLM